METRHPGNMNRRDLLKLGGGLLVTGAAALRGTRAAAAPFAPMQELPCLDGGPLYQEVYPTSPFILEPFTQDLPNPAPMKPSNPALWSDINTAGNGFTWDRPNCRTGGRQDADYAVHQVGYERIPIGTGTRRVSYLQYPEPLYYRLALQVGQHNITT